MKTCLYCGNQKQNDENNYCGLCGMPFEDGEISVNPGDVFFRKSSELSFNTELPPGIIFDNQYFVFPKKFDYKKYMIFSWVIRGKNEKEQKNYFF